MTHQNGCKFIYKSGTELFKFFLFGRSVVTNREKKRKKLIVRHKSFLICNLASRVADLLLSSVRRVLVTTVGYSHMIPPMKSPFPGMDPYLEARWGDVHQRLITYSADQLGIHLPADLRARVQERVFVEADAKEIRRVVPDVHVAEYPAQKSSPSAFSEGTGLSFAEPLVFLIQEDAVTEGFIEIRERSGGRVITVIEFLSPANKAGGEGQRLYQQKQKEILRSETNLVEIDLVRSGQRVLAFPEPRIPTEHGEDALVCIRRAKSERARELYALPLRERLPAIPIPLREQDRPVPLDLQALLDQCYHNGRYDDIDYTKAPVPELPPADAAWAESLLRTAGKR